MASWDSIPDAQKPFQRRLQEVFAGFVEHTDAQVGRLIDGLEQRGLRDNTIVFYIFGDNGASAEGQNGTISELLAQNMIPNTVEQQLAALDKIGGIAALGTNKTESMYHAGWAWAGDTPFRHTKLVASHFGGTRNPLVVSWPKGIKPDKTPRPQFHHVNDIAPTLYQILGITPPEEVNGQKQDPIDGVSMAYSFADPAAPGQKHIQYFDNNGSRAIYNDGWIAATFGPLVPWLPASPGLATWDSNKDVWELYNVKKDFSEADDLAAKEPARLEEMKKLFLKEAEANKAFPIGAGIWTRLHPEDRIKVPYTHWSFNSTTTRLPEFAGPGVGRESNRVIVDTELGKDASGVLYALGGNRRRPLPLHGQGPARLRIQHDDDRAVHRSLPQPIPAGKHRIVVDTKIGKPGGPAEVTISVDDVETMRVAVAGTVAGAFSASETLDVGVDLGSPVSFAYFDRAPFAFNGKIEKVDVTLR